MPYTAEISRVNPTCFLFLIDQSGSMAERFGGEAGKTKAEGVADAINRLLQTLVTPLRQGRLHPRPLLHRRGRLRRSERLETWAFPLKPWRGRPARELIEHPSA